jgi:hypothetical protein
MNCPLCKLINPDDSARCQCGYVFQSNPGQASHKNLNPLFRQESIPCESQGIVVNPPVPFESIVKFVIKLCIASIPAFIILALIALILYAVFGELIGKLVELIK